MGVFVVDAEVLAGARFGVYRGTAECAIMEVTAGMGVRR